MKIICLNCGKELSTVHDLYYDIESQKIGCLYCMNEKIKAHVKWCDE